ncbi:hypothetical protein SOVF_013080 [Spinacia oleracea]|nr:hypothetical protein SOVF_013080 [Spinacia oleracea]
MNSELAFRLIKVGVRGKFSFLELHIKKSCLSSDATLLFCEQRNDLSVLLDRYSLCLVTKRLMDLWWN